MALERNVSIAQVQNGMGQGRVLGAEAALAQNMVDGIASFNASTQRSSKINRLAQARRALEIL